METPEDISTQARLDGMMTLRTEAPHTTITRTETPNVTEQDNPPHSSALDTAQDRRSNMDKKEISIIQAKGHFEVAYIHNDDISEPQWAANWEQAKEIARKMQTEVGATRIVRNAINMQSIEVK